MEGRLLVSLVAGFLLVAMCTADPQAPLRRPQMNAQTRLPFPRPVQLNAQARNFVPNRFTPKKGYSPPVPPSNGGQLPGDSRNFIPNRFDIPASIIDKKPGSPVGCIGASPCGLVDPYAAPALPIPPPAAPFTGFPQPQNPYDPQGYVQSPPMATNSFGMHSIKALAQNTAEAVRAKFQLLGGTHPEKKFVPHIPPMGRPQQGKPPYNPPPPPPKPQVAAAGFAQPGQLPYQQPYGYGQQGMFTPQTAGFAPPQPVPGFAQPGAPPMQGNFADQPAFTAPVPSPQEQTPFAPQQPSPLGPQQQDVPQPLGNNVPQAPAINEPGQQMAPEGSFDLAKKRMMAMKVNGQMKRFGIPRPVQRSRLVPQPLFKRRH